MITLAAIMATEHLYDVLLTFSNLLDFYQDLYQENCEVNLGKVNHLFSQNVIQGCIYLDRHY